MRSCTYRAKQQVAINYAEGAETEVRDAEAANEGVEKKDEME